MVVHLFGRSFARAIGLAATGVAGLGAGLALGRRETDYLASASQTVSEPATSIVPFGYPDNRPLRLRDGHIVSYNNQTRTASYVCEHLTQESIRTPTSEKVDRALCVFAEDMSIHPFFRSVDKDYRGSGYDRGHLAAAANHRRSLNAMGSTFYFSNMCPQVGKGFNRDAWNNLEKYSRRLTRPLYLPQSSLKGGKKYVQYEVIGENNVAVPTHFFKLIAGVRANGAVELQSFIMPNAAIPTGQPLSAFLVPLEDVERKCGYLFYEKLPQKYSCTIVRNGRLDGLFHKEDVT